MSTLHPAIFLGHGSPMNALDDNTYTRAWNHLGETLPRPKAILVISAHWFIPATQVTAMDQPQTIHDFYGFPKALFDMQYPAPGAPDLAKRIQTLINDTSVELNQDWGLDHGAWGVLCHVYPKADIPVIQLSIDSTKPPAWHYALAKQLAPLREEGVLILGTGNVVHNLRAFTRDPGTPPFPWAQQFDESIRTAITEGDHNTLIEYQQLGDAAKLSVADIDHYLPLLYIMALQQDGEKVSFPTQGIDGGAISMTSVQVG